jgi:3-methyladenine DNA glycosylase/8-oxoguanine DNA glycosylase
MKRFRVDVPADFDFQATVWSHGWCFLEPFRSRDEGRILERALRLDRNRITRLEARQPAGRGGAVEVAVTGGAGARSGLPARDRAAVRAALGRMLRLDQDLMEFHERCRAAGPSFAGAPAAGFGRLLRSPTLFEDMVKVLATTNTAWSGTRAMVARLVALTGGAAFPSPAEVAALGAARLRSEGRWGYRAEYLASLAERVTAGELDLGSWERWEGSTEELEAEIRRLPGFGPYAAGHVLALLGRYDRIGVDTDFRSFVRRRHFPRARKAPSPRRMLAVYDRWGSWRFLAYWWELWSESYAAGEVLQAAEGG